MEILELKNTRTELKRSLNMLNSRTNIKEEKKSRMKKKSLEGNRPKC